VVQADIGIVVYHPTRRTTMQATNPTRKIVIALSAVLITAALTSAAAWHPGTEIMAASPVAAPTAPASVIGVPTGEYQNGVPVYRMPSIAVTVSRSEVLARMAREDALAMK
jgi:hypothetical protein